MSTIFFAVNAFSRASLTLKLPLEIEWVQINAIIKNFIIAATPPIKITITK
jgi:hypothetical protein